MADTPTIGSSVKTTLAATGGAGAPVVVLVWALSAFAHVQVPDAVSLELAITLAPFVHKLVDWLDLPKTVAPTSTPVTQPKA